MKSPERKPPHTPWKKLKSGSVIRMHSHNRVRDIGDDGATTPNVDINVQFEDRYLHRAEQSPEGSLEKSVKLKFAPAPKAKGIPSNPVKPDVVPHMPGIVGKAPETLGLEVFDQPSRDPVAPPPQFPPPRVRRLSQPDAPKAAQAKRKFFGPALVAMTAMAVLLPTQLDVGPGFDIFQVKEEIAATQTPATQVETEPKEVRTASREAAPAQEAAEIRVAASPEPELETKPVNSNLAVPLESESEVDYVATLAHLDRLKNGTPQPPTPQKLAPPSGPGAPAFTASVPVATPPDPNEMGAVPDNPFADPPSFSTQPSLRIASNLAIPPQIWAANGIAAPVQTDLAAVASPAADPPPLQQGPVVFVNLTEPQPESAQQNEPISPTLSKGSEMSWQSAMSLRRPEQSGTAYIPPQKQLRPILMAAVAVILPEPLAPRNETADAKTPKQTDTADLRQQFIKPPQEKQNSDSAVDPEISEPAIPPAPKLGEGPLKILSQYWRTQIELEFDDLGEGGKIVNEGQNGPDWLVSGAVISSIEGRELRTRADYLAGISTVCTEATSGKAELGLVVNGASETLPVTCLRRTALSNGLVLEARYKRRKWKIQVAQEAVPGLSTLKIGDLLLLDYRRDATLNSPDALREALTAARKDEVNLIELGIIRNGAIETAELKISQ